MIVNKVIMMRKGPHSGSKKLRSDSVLRAAINQSVILCKGWKRAALMQKT